MRKGRWGGWMLTILVGIVLSAQPLGTGSAAALLAPRVHGDGGVQARFGVDQARPGACGPTAAAIVISAFNGARVSAASILADSESIGLMHTAPNGIPDSWMLLSDVASLLGRYGIPARALASDPFGLRRALDEGRQIILRVDAGELWGRARGTDDDQNGNHFVVLTEIDDLHGTVTLNDPGRSPAYGFEPGKGIGWTVPLARLLDAWADGGYDTVVTVPVPLPFEDASV